MSLSLPNTQVKGLIRVDFWESKPPKPKVFGSHLGYVPTVTSTNSPLFKPTSSPPQLAGKFLLLHQGSPCVCPYDDDRVHAIDVGTTCDPWKGSRVPCHGKSSDHLVTCLMNGNG